MKITTRIYDVKNIKILNKGMIQQGHDYGEVSEVSQISVGSDADSQTY